MLIKSRIALWLSLIATLFGPIFFPKLHLFYFVPYLVICLYQHTRLAVLWRAYFCGIFLDLLSSNPILGLSSLNYSLVSWLLYKQTRNFFDDKLSTLPLMTFLFSFLSTLVSLVLSLFFGHSFSLNWTWVASDLVGMSFVDSLYALLVFSLPLQLIYRLRKLRFKKISS